MFAYESQLRYQRQQSHFSTKQSSRAPGNIISNGESWVAGSTLAYRKSFWADHRSMTSRWASRDSSGAAGAERFAISPIHRCA